jgi:hypothetical protein
MRSAPPAEPTRRRPSRTLAAEPLEDRSLLNATLSVSDTWVYEQHDGTFLAAFTVTLSEPAGETVTVAYATADGTAKAKSDYLATSGTLTFAPGETTKTITVAVKGDMRVEDDEYFTVNLSSAVGATIEDGRGIGSILNDDYRSSYHCPPHDRTC